MNIISLFFWDFLILLLVSHFNNCIRKVQGNAEVTKKEFKKIMFGQILEGESS